MMERRWLTVKETANYLGLHHKTIYRLTAKRAIPFTKVSGIGVRIDLKELNNLLERSEEYPKNFNPLINSRGD